MILDMAVPNVAAGGRRVPPAKKEGRKSHAELRAELVALVRQLRPRRPKWPEVTAGHLTLTLRGYVNERGRPFSAASIAAMLATRPLVPTHTLS